MIVEDMRNTGVLGQPEEWFVPWSAKKPGINWRQALGGVVKRSTSDNGIAAIKVMANQLAPVEDCLATFMDAPSEAPYSRFAQVTKTAKFVKLERGDLVYQAISRVIARQTGINHATGQKGDTHFAGNLMDGYQSDYNARTRYDYKMIRDECTRITLENLAWNRFFEAHGIVPEVLRYEDVSQDPNMTHLDMLAGLLDVTLPKERAQRKMVKLGNSRNTEWREKFYTDLGDQDFS